MLYTRAFKAGPQFTFRVASKSAAIVARFEGLFCDLDNSNSETVFELNVLIEDAGFRLDRSGRSTIYPDLAQLIGGLMSTVNRLVLDTEKSSLHLHAGAVSRSDRSALIVARSAGGKTTTVATLAKRGWGYLTDETISLKSDDGTIGTWPKPLSIKKTGFQLFEELTDLPLHGQASHIDREFVPATKLSFGLGSAIEPYLIAILDPDAKLDTQLTPGEVVVQLIENCHDFDRFGPGGLERLCRLSSRCSTTVVPRDEPHKMADQIERAWEAADTSTASTEVVDLTHNLMGVSVSAVAIGDELVVHNRTSGTAAVLNADGSKVFQDLARSGFEASTLSDGNRQYLTDLRAAGLLD